MLSFGNYPFTVGSKVLYRDERIGGQVGYILTDQPEILMQIPDKIRKCVMFVGYKEHNGIHKFAGTAFIVLRPIEGITGQGFTYIVTAKHVLDKIRDKFLDKVYLRANFADGNAYWVETNINDWFPHPEDAEVDVAVLPISLDLKKLDHRVYSILSFATDEIVKQRHVSLGDEVFLAGLFARHYGIKRNIPIVRVGNIAAMPEERVETAYGLIDAYLIEARSIGGISGSPVFVNLGQIRRAPDGSTALYAGGVSFYLLGLMHGHWNTSPAKVDAGDEDAIGEERVNMGIAIVVPATKILEVLNQPMIRKKEKEVEERLRKEQLPTPDSVDDGLTEEGFEEALQRASRKTSSLPESESDET
jgi:hypothetical protein